VGSANLIDEDKAIALYRRLRMAWPRQTEYWSSDMEAIYVKMFWHQPYERMRELIDLWMISLPEPPTPEEIYAEIVANGGKLVDRIFPNDESAMPG
jgi:hypothetical protein